MLDAQGEEILAGEVRYFAKHLPPVLTDRQQLAAKFLRFKGSNAGPNRKATRKPIRGTRNGLCSSASSERGIGGTVP